MINIPKFSSPDQLDEFVSEWAKKNTVSIDNRDWYFCVVIDNGKQRTLFTKSGIETLVIEDDLFQWYTKGYITLKNDENSLERGLGPQKVMDFFRLGDTYKMRGDSRDIVSISITPKLNVVTSYLAKISGLEPIPDEDIYKLSNDFAVYDTKTEYDNGATYKTLYFWDFRYQLLLERDAHYSTGLVKNKTQSDFGKKIRQVNNKDRSIKTGLAIQEFIKQNLSDLNPQFDNELWDPGGTNVFYSSPAQYKCINDLDWLLDSHVSSDDNDNDFCILKYDNYTKKWTLLSINKYFEKALDKDEAGEYQYDKFQISYHSGPLPKFLSFLSAGNKAPKLSLSDLNGKVKSKVPLPYFGKNRRKNMTPGESMELENIDWKFEDLSGIDNQTLLTTYAVHSYNMHTHEFNIDVYKNEIQTVAENFQTQYVEKNFIGDDKPVLNFNITPGKKERTVYNNLFTLSDEQKSRAIKGRNQLYKNLIFLNNACSLSVKGDTHRRTGRFFSIDRVDTYFDNEFDEKVLGQYLTVNVKHIFEKETYRNEMLGVKPYRYSQPNFERKKIVK